MNSDDDISCRIRHEDGDSQQVSFDSSSSVEPQLDHNPRTSTRFTCHLDKSATVELQLVLQFLDTRNKLKVSRCNRRMLQVTKDPFAWRGVPPLVVNPRSLMKMSTHSQMLRLIPLSLWIDYRISAFELDHIMKLSSDVVFRELHIDEYVEDCDCEQRVSFQDMQPLQATKLIAHLPHLQSIFIQQGEDVGELLKVAPVLTQLIITLTSWETELVDIQSISHCLHLQYLKLRGAKYRVHGFNQLFLTQPSQSQQTQQQKLKRLELEGFLARFHPNWSFAVPSAEDMHKGLSEMHHLTELHLKRIYGIDALLDCVHALPALRVLQLALIAEHPDSISYTGSIHPSVDTVRALLTRAPQLEVHLLIAPSADEWIEYAKRDDTGSAWCINTTMEQWYQLHHDFHDIPRVTIVHE